MTKITKEQAKDVINRINFEQIQLIADRTGLNSNKVFDVLIEIRNHVKGE